MIEWFPDQQQTSFVREVFDLTVKDPIEVAVPGDIDVARSLSIGQNRAEMALDEETVELIAMYMNEGVAMPMPLVWRASARSKLVVLDGNHRIAAARRNDAVMVPAVLVAGDEQVAQRLAIVVNMQHGRSARDPSYAALAMRALRDQGVPLATIALMFGVSEGKVGVVTRREAQQDRLRTLLPERRTRVPMHTLDLLAQIEDAHIRVLGDAFLDAPKVQQEEAARRLRETPSAERDAAAHEIRGELRELARAKSKVKGTASRPASQLQGALTQLAKVTDPTRAYFEASDQHRAIMRSHLVTVMPRLERLWSTATGAGEVA